MNVDEQWKLYEMLQEIRELARQIDILSKEAQSWFDDLVVDNRSEGHEDTYYNSLNAGEF
tara:strand:+ start:1073 stop:1252 length:180 start_codon:yes stop_codon:yes gene_type:complete